jgi:probable HAF family extracellular repeat protein
VAGALAAGARADSAIELGTLGGIQRPNPYGDDWSEVRGINDSGEVVGRSSTIHGGSHAFLWTASLGMVDLGTLGGDGSEAVAINDSGQVAGDAETDNAGEIRPGSGANCYHAFLWTAAGGMVDIGPPDYTSRVAALSPSGQVVGIYYPCPGGHTRAFSWTHAGGFVDLGTLGGVKSEPTAVNEGGEVTGESETRLGASEAFSWTQAGGMVGLGTLTGFTGSSGRAINDHGEIIGTDGEGEDRAFSWTGEGGLIDLGTLPGDKRSEGVAINDSGQVVGNARGEAADSAFSWTQAGGMVRVEGLGEAVAISDSGEVIGPGGSCRGAAWTQAGGTIALGAVPGYECAQPVAVNDAGQIAGDARGPLEVKEPDPVAVLWNTTDSTSTRLSCVPVAVFAGAASTCKATVTDTETKAPSAPTGALTFTSSGPGSFRASGCILAPAGAVTASCQFAYTPSAPTSSPARTDVITARYTGDSLHGPSSGVANVQVLAAAKAGQRCVIGGGASWLPRCWL